MNLRLFLKNYLLKCNGLKNYENITFNMITLYSVFKLFNKQNLAYFWPESGIYQTVNEPRRKIKHSYKLSSNI